MTQEKRGGLRTPSGGRPKKPDKRITVQICLSPDSAEYLAEMGKEKNNFINNLLDKERGKTTVKMKKYITVGSLSADMRDANGLNAMNKDEKLEVGLDPGSRFGVFVEGCHVLSNATLDMVEKTLKEK